ncbi:glycosyltransferase family 9 protein [Pedobacter sp. SYSU D00535]|uniref:glycosyltransferase family 9 protein n=1 Tax=Pedobacter sp. SYSU D00535 TaxID=2810308 RepID=UPI001A96AB6E|nr:glycosyltransferase family 9 protein [Pedobacter sp. SYSU D00535]
MINTSDVKKIAVLRANALGDYIFVLPALQALRDRYPQAEIVYLGRQWHKEYLQDRPGPVDRVVVVPPYGGISEVEGFVPDEAVLSEFFSEMHKEEFDIAFQLHGGGGNSNPFLLRLGAKLTVGLKTPNAAPLDISVPYVYYFSEVLRYLEVVAKVGATTAAIEPVAAVMEKDFAEARKVIRPGDKPIAVIHPGASDMRRRWPRENFAAVADYLFEKGYDVYISGVPFESEVVNEVMDKVKYKTEIKNLCSQLSLSGMTGLLSLADVLVSNDTGPLHLARALKTPTVGIYWCGNLVTGLPMSTSQNRSLPSFSINCPLCGLSATKFGKDDDGSCKHETSFVADVTVESVVEAIDELLSSGVNKEVLAA